MKYPTEKWLERLNEIKNDLIDYVEGRLQLLALQGIESLSAMVTKLVQKVTSLIFLLLATLFLMFAAAFLIGEWLDSLALGFALVALPFLILGFYFHRSQSKTLTAKIEREVFKAFEPLFDKKKKENP